MKSLACGCLAVQKVFLKRLLGGLSFKSYMAAVGKWGGRIGYVGNLKGCPYIHCNPPFVHSSNKAWSVPRLLRHGVSGLGVLGGTGAQCTANGKRQRVGGALRYHGPCIFISFSALEQGDPQGVPCPQRYHFSGARLREYPFLSRPRW